MAFQPQRVNTKKLKQCLMHCYMLFSNHMHLILNCGIGYLLPQPIYVIVTVYLCLALFNPLTRMYIIKRIYAQ